MDPNPDRGVNLLRHERKRVQGLLLDYILEQVLHESQQVVVVEIVPGGDGRDVAARLRVLF